MSKEWKQYCKDCGREFGYSHSSYLADLERGFSRPERCPEHRRLHSKEIGNIASSHFKLKPRKTPFPILGLPFLGQLSRGNRELVAEEKSSNLEQFEFGITDEDIRNLYKALHDYQVVVIVGPTGSGKSTYLPFRLVEPLDYEHDYFTRNGSIIVTQPRIQATRSIPAMVGEKLLGTSIGPGYEVGYRYRHAEEYDGRNRLVYVTDGSLLNWIAEGKTGKYGIIMIDEAHERSCNIDLILSLLKRELPKYPHLRLIIASATIDAESFLDSFQEVTSSTKLEFKGIREFGYQVKFREDKPLSFSELPEALGNKVMDILNNTNDGGILGFLPGQAEIMRAVDTVGNNLNVIRKTKSGGYIGFLPHKKGDGSVVAVLPLYTALGVEEGKEALNPLEPVEFKGQKVVPRRVVIATNVAETSLTVPDVVYVVDSGLIKQAEWDVNARVVNLVTRRHSKAGCKQRWGRSGRVAPGEVHTLYTREEFNEFDDHTSPEITRSCLDDIALNAKGAGIVSLDDVPWLDSPMPQELNRVNQIFRKRSVMDTDGDLTEYGHELWRIQRVLGGKNFGSFISNPLDNASLLIQADRFGCAVEAAAALAFMVRMGDNIYHSLDGLYQWNPDWDAFTKDHVDSLHRSLKIECCDDLDLAIKLADSYRRGGSDWTRRFYINEDNISHAWQEAEAMIMQLSPKDDQVRDLKWGLLDRLRLIMYAAWPDRIGIICEEGTGFYLNDDAETQEKVEISNISAGSWTEGEHAVCGAMVRKYPSRDKNTKGCLTGCFFVKNPSLQSTEIEKPVALLVNNIRKEASNIDLSMRNFPDQVAPPGSTVRIEDDGRGSKIVSIIDYGKPLQPYLNQLSLDAAGNNLSAVKDQNKDYDKKTADVENQEPLFCEEEEDKVGFPHRIKWAGIKRSKKAKVVEWLEKDNKATALLEPVLENKTENSNCQDNSLKITIDRVVMKDPLQRSGWIRGISSTGQCIPIELARLSLSPLGYGLHWLEGENIELDLEDYDQKRCWPILGNFVQITQDLEEHLKKAASKKPSYEREQTRIDLEGYVEYICHKQNNILVVAPREGSVIHHFEINENYLPCAREELTAGEKVIIGLFPRKDRDSIKASLFLQDELDNLPKGWILDQDNNKVRFPFCLKDEDLTNWQARYALKELVKRHSWRFCFNTRVLSTERYLHALGCLKEGQRIECQVIEAARRKDGSFSGLKVYFTVSTSEGEFIFNAFMPMSAISWHQIKAPYEVLDKDETLEVKVKEIGKHRLPPRLYVSRKTAFTARAVIPENKIGKLIGRKGETIRSVKGEEDVSIDLESEPGFVIVQAPLPEIRDWICQNIEEVIPEVGKWRKD